MLIGLRGACCLNSTAEEQYCSKASLALKGQPYFCNSGPRVAAFKSVPRNMEDAQPKGAGDKVSFRAETPLRRRPYR